MFSFIPPVIAHRGASAQAPENTLAAFRKARAIGATWVEFDVMLAACGEAVVIHDETIDRTTNGTGKVSDHPYQYLKTLDAGSWFNPIFSAEKIPTLAEVIAVLYHEKLNANIEIKALSGQEEKTVKKILHILSEHWQKDQSPPLISSFSLPALHYVKKYSPQSFLGFLMDKWQHDWEKTCDELSCVAVDMNYKILNVERINAIKKTQRFLLSYTVNNPTKAQKLFSLGVNAVFSDCPAHFLPFLCI